MSDRLERQSREPEREETPNPTDEKLFNFLEDKWKNREKGPSSLRMHLAFGPGGGNHRPEVIHEKEFKANADPPTKPELVAMANTFYEEAQRHTDELGKAQAFVIVAHSPVKGAHPYGSFFRTWRPINPMQRAPGDPETEGEQRSMIVNEGIAHTKESNEHVRFMADANFRHTTQLLALYHQLLREERERNMRHETERSAHYKALEELSSKKHEREMEKEKQQLLMGLAQGGLNLLGKALPSIGEALARRGDAGMQSAPLDDSPITPTPESNAIAKFAGELNDEQRTAIFGCMSEGVHVPGILSTDQVGVIGGVGDLKLRRSALDLLRPGAQHQIRIDQVTRMAQHVPGGITRLIALQNEMLGGQAPAPAEQQNEVSP